MNFFCREARLMNSQFSDHIPAVSDKILDFTEKRIIMEMIIYIQLPLLGTTPQPVNVFR